MTTAAQPIRSLADIQSIEKTPLAQCDLPASTYEFIKLSNLTSKPAKSSR